MKKNQDDHVREQARKEALSYDLNSSGMRHEYVSQVDMTRTQAKINKKDEDPASDSWKGLYNRDDFR